MVEYHGFERGTEENSGPGRLEWERSAGAALRTRLARTIVVATRPREVEVRIILHLTTRLLVLLLDVVASPLDARECDTDVGAATIQGKADRYVGAAHFFFSTHQEGSAGRTESTLSRAYVTRGLSDIRGGGVRFIPL